MPYLLCPSCGLKVFIVAGHSRAGEECPRCGAVVDPKPRRPFERGPGARDPRRRNIQPGKGRRDA